MYKIETCSHNRPHIHAYKIAARMPPNTPATTPSCPTAKGSAALEVVVVALAVVVEALVVVLEEVVRLDVVRGVEIEVEGTDLQKKADISMILARQRHGRRTARCLLW